MKWNKHLSKEKCIVMKTGIGTVSNKNGACENELIRNSLLPLPCLIAFSVSFLLLLGWNPAEQRAGEAEAARPLWRCGKAVNPGSQQRAGRIPRSRLVALPAGIKHSCARGGLPHTHWDCCCTHSTLTWQILALIRVLMVVKTWILLRS